ncbi:MAG: hypothetical protein EXX96DRAFT_590512 [Benjaminiella poitrasii]|nr:MAG: hypothetical protein EXX96DRAFT_590512 [Benjaminiella poitrasii]
MDRSLNPRCRRSPYHSINDRRIGIIVSLLTLNPFVLDGPTAGGRFLSIQMDDVIRAFMIFVPSSSLRLLSFSTINSSTIGYFVVGCGRVVFKD